MNDPSAVYAYKPQVSRGRRVLFLAITLLIIIFLAGAGVYFAKLKMADSSVEIVFPVRVDLSSNLSRLELAEAFGGKLGWDEKQARTFQVIYPQVQWAAFNAVLLEIFSERFEWDALLREKFLINSTSYLDPEHDFLSEAYVPDVYILEEDKSPVEIAEMLVRRVKEHSERDLKTSLSSLINSETADRVAEFVERSVELLPDLVPLPAEDLHLLEQDGKILLQFSTIYYNRGEGPLELHAEERPGVSGDVESDVFQRIYRIDESVRDKVAGTFLWHDEHLHYHFADFITYDLSSIHASLNPELDDVQAKATFCVRDVSTVDLDLPNRPADAKYKICGKYLQGISVGWADTYFYTYADQNLDISDLSSGTYRLSFYVDPSRLLDELNYDNNESSVLLFIDMENKTVEIVEKDPADAPAVEHVYREQVTD